MASQEAFRLECGHAPEPGGGDRLSVGFVSDVTGGKDAGNVRGGVAGRG